MNRSRIVAALLACLITAGIFAVPSLARGFEELMDMGTYYFFVIEDSAPSSPPDRQ